MWVYYGAAVALPLALCIAPLLVAVEHGEPIVVQYECNVGVCIRVQQEFRGWCYV